MTGNNTIKQIWDAVMDERQSPLKNLSLPTAHMVMQLLAWLWSAIFSLSLGSYLVFGVTAVFHVLVIAGIFITFMVFQKADDKSST
jgi:hypothetical protein